MTDGFPTIKKSIKTGETGVNAVSSIVNDTYGWIFRRNHNEHDFGVDGYIDVVSDNGAVTGQCIAIQIKTGKSFLKRQTANGFTFYGEKKHLNYYLNLSMPVLVIIHDDVSHKTYWQHFDPSRTEGTPTGWKMTVPSSNRFESAKSKLFELVGPAKNHLNDLESHWAFTDTMSQFDFIHYAIDRSDIESGKISSVLQFFQRIESSDALCRKFQGRVELSVSGYDQDPRELWEINAIRKWYKKADAKINWFFFCNVKSPAHGFKAFMTCTCNTKRETNQLNAQPGSIHVSVDTRMQNILLENNWPKLNAMTDRLSMSIEENKRISFEVFDAMGIPHD